MSSFCAAKATHIFFSKKFQHICVSLDVNFNESLNTTSLALNNWAQNLIGPYNVYAARLISYVFATKRTYIYTLSKSQNYSFPFYSWFGLTGIGWVEMCLPYNSYLPIHLVTPFPFGSFRTYVCLPFVHPQLTLWLWYTGHIPLLNQFLPTE